MKISHRSWAIRYAYGMDSMLRPGERVFICELFWKMVTTTLGWGLILLILGMIAFTFLVLPVVRWGWGGLLVAPTIVACLLVGNWLHSYLMQRRFEDYPRQPGIIRQYIRAKKERWCPIVEVTE